MHKIELKGIRCYGRHGCLPEEKTIGQEYVVNVLIMTDFTEAVNSDELQDTIDYCEVYAIVKKHMDRRKKLIEAVGHMIAQEIRNNWDSILSCSVEVIKPRPPINGEVQEVSISVTA